MAHIARVNFTLSNHPPLFNIFNALFLKVEAIDGAWGGMTLLHAAAK